MYVTHWRAGVGLLLGAAGRLVDVEVDDRVLAEPVLTRLFPGGLPETLGWDSSRGSHMLFLYDERLAAFGTIVKGVLNENGHTVGNDAYLVSAYQDQGSARSGSQGFASWVDASTTTVISVGAVTASTASVP
jgi:hypothetical protein